mmetsp:Transcript_10933/g.45924  ORF Transcript_10933/g.45924 Transcript_10933/m.45924 type:complete len:441 (+) Transcript_10933:2307-3629(+)
MHRRARRALELLGVVHGVVRDEVDVRRELLGVEQPGERLGVLRRVVHARQQGVLERHAAPRRDEVLLAVVQQVVQRVRLGARDERLAQRLVRRVQRNRQRALQLRGGEPLQTPAHAHGAYGDVPGADTHLAVQRVVRAKHVRYVQQRFAHAHEHHVRDARPEVLLERNHLVHNLVRRQVPGEPPLARGAERAAHGAADLRGDARGEPVLAVLRGGDAHRLHHAVVREPEQQLGGAVGGGGDVVHDRPTDVHVRRLQRLSHALGQRREVVHRARGRRAVQVVAQLLPPERGQAVLLRKRLQLSRRQPQQVELSGRQRSQQVVRGGRRRGRRCRQDGALVRRARVALGLLHQTRVQVIPLAVLHALRARHLRRLYRRRVFLRGGATHVRGRGGARGREDARARQRTRAPARPREGRQGKRGGGGGGHRTPTSPRSAPESEWR